MLLEQRLDWPTAFNGGINDVVTRVTGSVVDYFKAYYAKAASTTAKAASDLGYLSREIVHRTENLVSNYGATALKVAAGSALIGGLVYGSFNGYEGVTFPTFTLAALIGMGYFVYHITKQADNGVHLNRQFFPSVR